MNLNKPELFTDAQLAADNYPEDLLPEMLWAACPEDLKNLPECEVLSYKWIEIFDREVIAQTIKESRPHIALGSMFFVSSLRAAEVA